MRTPSIASAFLVLCVGCSVPPAADPSAGTTPGMGTAATPTGRSGAPSRVRSRPDSFTLGAMGAVRELPIEGPPPSYSIGGTVTGLVGSGLVLDNNGELLSIETDGSFVFPTPISVGASYDIIVVTQPSGPQQACTVAAGAGTLSAGEGEQGAADVTNIVVTCTTDTYTIGGNVSGLAGTGLVLTDNDGDDLAVDTDRAFVFVTPLASGAGYSVAVKTNPSYPWQHCVVSSAAGTVDTAAITDVTVTCTTDTHTIGGSVMGLSGSLVLSRGSDSLSISASGSFVFPAIYSGTYYDVVVTTQPAGQHCSVANGTGPTNDVDVTNVDIQCVTASCVNLGWNTGDADWTCPTGLRMPTTDEMALVSPCIDPADEGRFASYADIGVSVGGCGCTWNAGYCDVPSIETMRAGRACGDYEQLHICVPQ